MAVINYINGPVVKVIGAPFSMLEMVYVSKNKLLGEVIKIDKDYTTIQVYEQTTSVKVGDTVTGTGYPVSLNLGPGLIGNIFDGIGRPLKILSENSPDAYIPIGSNIDSLDTKKLWDIEIIATLDQKIKGGEIFGKTKETESIIHYLLVPFYISGTITKIVKSAKYNVTTTLLEITDSKNVVHKITASLRNSIKKARPVKSRLPITVPLITGQRIIDTFFPIPKGGCACIPGGFGTGKTMMQHQFAKWCDADIIVYIGCGERGNEMSQILEEFSELKDPRNNKPLLERTILIANTSNMPVAAREASIYTGITIAEYYRDMGYHVAIMADSTSRWAEALREISGRLEEMPAEEGFPAYLPSRISEFYERAGFMDTLSHQVGSVTIVGAVSPQGADFSEPVTQNTKRFVRAFWALDKALAYSRHYPAINWNISYSEYIPDLAKWYNTNVSKNFLDARKEVMKIMAEENKLLEIAKLIGTDVLPDDQRLIITIGKVIRNGFLQQNSFHKDDTFVSLTKQLKMMEIILYLYRRSILYLSSGRVLRQLLESGIFEDVIKIKYDIPNDKLELFVEYYSKIDQTIEGLR